MASDRTSIDDAIRIVHAQRDVEESERVRQLGGLLVHDLNNVLFALLGRLQLLQRRAADAETKDAAAKLLETARLLESQVVRLHAACQREGAGADRSNARAAVGAALRESVATLPSSLRPLDLEATVGAIPADASFEGDASQMAVALRQALALHRARARGPLTIEISATAGDDAAITITVSDDGGAPRSIPTAPSLLGDGFDLSELPLAAAHRAIRDVGGSITCSAIGVGSAATGLRTTIHFSVSRTISIARLDAAGTQTAPGHCDDEDACVPPARRVLVADDDVSVRAVLVAALEAIGDEVDTLNTPGSCDAHPDLASFDVVILDAGGGGIEALARLRARGVGVPVLVASGEEIALRPDPLTRFLLKPFPLKSLDRELAALSALKIRA